MVFCSRLRRSTVAVIAIALGGCTVGSAPPGESPAASPSPETALRVVTTFVPITAFTKAVVGDRAQVVQLLPLNTGPHDYQAKPEEVQKLTKADVLVKNGLEMESFLDGLVKSAGNPKLTVIDTSKGIQPIASGGESAHGHETAKDHDPDHDHGAEQNTKADATHKHGEFNPHIWLDPKRAIQQVENIRDSLATVDPQGQAAYTANAAAYIQKLQALDQDFTQALQPFAGKTFVTYHDFASYFAQSYNLKAEFLVGIPEENASPEDVKRVMSAAQASNLKTLLTEPQAVNNPFAALAQDLKVSISNFDPLETTTADSVQPNDYLTTMRQNLANLKTAFGRPTQQSQQPWLLPTRAAGSMLPATLGLGLLSRPMALGR